MFSALPPITDIAQQPMSESLLVCQRLACQRLGDHGVDLGGVQSPRGMIDQRLREGEHDGFVLLDDRRGFLITMLDEGQAARVGAADNSGDCIRAVDIALYLRSA